MKDTEKYGKDKLEVAIGMCVTMALFNAVKSSSKMELSKMFEIMKTNLLNQGMNPDVVAVSIEDMRSSERWMRSLLW